MNDVSADHPSPQVLTAFGLGHLAGRDARTVEQHLALCDTCRTAVDSVPADSFVSLLRAARRPLQPPTTPPDDGSAPHGAGTEVAPASATAAGTTPLALADHPRYRVLELLGVGGMGAVYRAEHQLMERTVALKVINRSLTDNPAMVERFRREVKAAAKLSHPNIVHAYDADQAGDTHFLVMEYVEGTSLARLATEQGRLPVAQACDYVRQAALGLQHAHERGMVHRDIKPHNLMLTPDGQVKILDFGLARFAMEATPAGALLTAAAPAPAAGESLTQVGTVVGTPDYIAPEQIRDAHTADIRADLYSLGCTLYDLLAGQAPFPEGTVVQKVMAHLEQAPRPLIELRADVPADLARVVQRLMAKDPAQRYATPADVVAALTPFTGASRPRPANRGRRWLLAATAAALLLAVGILFGAGASLALVLLTGRTHVEQPEPVVTGLPQEEKPAALEKATPVGEPLEHARWVRGIAFTADSKLLITACADGKLRAWDVATGKRRGEPMTAPHSINCLALSPDGTIALVGCGDSNNAHGEAQLWDVGTSKLLATLDTRGPVWGVAFSEDAKLLTGTYHPADKTSAAQLWEWDGEKVRQLRDMPHDTPICTVALSPDGKTAATGSADDKVRLWETERGTLVGDPRRLRCKIRCVAFAPRRTHVLAACGEEHKGGEVYVWSGALFGYLDDIQANPSRLPRASPLYSVAEIEKFYAGDIQAAIFSPNAKYLFVGLADRTAQLSRLNGPAVSQDIRCPVSVLTVAYSPDGQFVAVGGAIDNALSSGKGAAQLYRLPAKLWDVGAPREFKTREGGRR
jgi:predicted Ser/Thr protein kinase